MSILLSLLPFAFISAFTPGPTNILVMSQGINYGFRQTLKFQLGAGFSCFILFFAFMLLGSYLETLLPSIIPTMKYVGCAYMCYLAWIVYSSKPTEEDEDAKTPTFIAGFFLQFLNPKYYFFVLTLTAGLLPIIYNAKDIVLYTCLFVAITASGWLAWAYAGSLLQNFLKKWYQATNTVMALALVGCAYTLL